MNNHEWKKEAKHIHDLKKRIDSKKIKVLKLTKNYLKPTKSQSKNIEIKEESVKRKKREKKRSASKDNWSTTSRKKKRRANTSRRAYSIRSGGKIRRKRIKAFMSRVDTDFMGSVDNEGLVS